MPLNKRRHIFGDPILPGCGPWPLSRYCFSPYTQWWSGGFLGVDIFFVISGYLISGIIFRGLINKNFSYANFYAKRIRRIIPNLLLVLSFVFVLGYFFLFAQEFAALGKHIYSSATFIQNFRLLRESGDYFATASINQPLLHLWSLAIEEQFYIVFPLLASLICFIGKGSKLAVGAMVGGITLSSFIACILTKNPSDSFYFPLTRFWEIGAGMCLAYVETYRILNFKSINPSLRSTLSVIGLGMVLFAMAYYHTDIRTPGWYSLLPVLGACSLIAAHEDALINRTFLSWKWVSFIGLISYSLYLWHWPILSYLHIVVTEPTTVQLWAALIVSALVSIFIYRFVENPMRTTKRFSQKAIVGLLSLGLVGVFGLGQLLWKTNGLPQREFTQRFIEFEEMRADFSEPQNDLSLLNVNGNNLYVTNPDKMPEILFIGDSHTNQYILRIKELSKLTNQSVAVLTGSGCLVASGVAEVKDQSQCIRANKALTEILKLKTIHTVVWGQMWGKEFYSSLLDESAEKIKALILEHPQQKHFVLLDYPWDESGSFEIQKYIHFNRLTTKNLDGLNFQQGLPQDQSWLVGNERIQNHLNSFVQFIHTDEQVCPNGQCDLLNTYRDNDHLRSSYLKENATWLNPIFNLTTK